MSYNNTFSKFYDDFVGSRTKTDFLLNRIIKKYSPGARSILEFACGTGELLVPLSKKYIVAGVDASPHMLKVATKKLPKAAFTHGDMRTINLESKFDVIFVLFDSLNHLSTLAQWEKVFANTQKHLNHGGICVFDFNTEYKLHQLSLAGEMVKRLSKSTVRYKIIKKGNVYHWKIFMTSGETEDITEVSFPLADVKKVFKKYFKIESVFDEKYGKPCKTSRRIYLVGKI